MNDLVDRLSTGEHPIEVSLRPDRTIAAFKECIDRGWVHIRFTNTRGGTELGVPLDRDRCRFDTMDVENGTGHATIVGELTLDFVRVRCVARVSLPEMKGTGHLEQLEVGSALPVSA